MANKRRLNKNERELAYNLRKLDVIYGSIRMFGYVLIATAASWATVQTAQALAGQDTRLNLSMQIAWGAAGALGLTLTAQVTVSRRRKKKIQRQRELIDTLEEQLLQAQGKTKKREEKP